MVLPVVAENFRPEPLSRLWMASWPLGNVFAVLHGLSSLCLLAFILWSSGDGWKEFGIGKLRAFPDLLIAVFLSGLMVTMAHFVIVPRIEPLIQPYMRDVLVPKGSFAIELLVAASVLSALVEEVFFRGYLVPRLEELTSRIWIGVAISAVLYAFVHVYLGPVQALAALGMGLTFGAAFVGERTLWPLVIANITYKLALTFMLMRPNP